jgi:hypothetical protein
MVWAYNWANEQVQKPPAEEAYSSTEYYYEINPEGKTYSISWVFWLPILIFVVPFVLTSVTMSYAWDRFAKVNGFTQLPPVDPHTRSIMKVPSFQGKLLAMSLGPIQGAYKDHPFALHSRQYKEGGLLRWREKQMDTVLTMLLPVTLPHIVINARGNERARRSNLSKSFPSENKFQFEGTMGSRYDVYAKPESRVTALQLFTPDVLQVLYEKLPNADLELLDDKLWIVQRYGVLDDKLAQTMLQAADSLYDELEKQLRVAGLLLPRPNTVVQ